ncbi:MAG: hypothetical protein IIB45_00160 [Candidatus Marinimicrobia bacterium]|nr:hypothetical protein [Candidatus Neomarinimicrobiota bacterium]
MKKKQETITILFMFFTIILGKSVDDYLLKGKVQYEKLLEIVGLKHNYY